MATILETPRLRLRELTPGDLDFVATMLADPEVMRYYPKTYSRAEAREWLDRQIARYRAHGHGLWLVEDPATGQSIGQVGLLLQQVEGQIEPEIGYLIHAPFWRRGYATEAALGVRRHAWGVLARRRLISLIRPENLPSQGVARKLGMRPEREVAWAGLRHTVWALAGPPSA